MTTLALPAPASAICAEMDRLKVLMRDCQHGFRSRPFEHIRKDAEICAAAMKRIEGMAAGAESDIQVEYMFLCRDYSCLAARVALAAKKQPKQRSYLSLPKAYCTLEADNPGPIEELRKVLAQEGIDKHLKFEIAGNKICFHHGRRVLEALVTKYPKLGPFFMKGGEYCLFKDKRYTRVMSEKRLWENPAVKAKLVSSLGNQARNDFFSHPVPAPVKFTFSPTASDKENIIAAYRRFPCLCIGESHDHTSPKRFLIDNMETLRDLGVKTLFMEDFLYDTQQPLLDHYFDTPGAEIPPLLQIEGDCCDAACGISPPYSYLNVLRKAKKCGIRVVGIDSSVAFEVEENNKYTPLARIQAMNFVAKQIIDREKGDGKYLAFMGLAHAGSMVQTSSSIPLRSSGLADVLQCPLITIDETPSTKPNAVNTAITGLEDGDWSVAHTHLLLESSKTLKNA